MAKAKSRVILMFGGIVALTGCQSFGDFHFSHRSREEVQTAQKNQVLFTQRGIEELKLGNNGRAIEAFNMAIATGEEPAPALNGLGVAYARLGRPDLAYRFFRKATVAMPGNEVFARNLVRLMDSPEFAEEMARRQKQRSVLAASEESRIKRVDQSTADARVAVGLHRDGNRQFTLITSPAPAASLAQGSIRSADSCHSKLDGRRSVGCDRVQLPRTGSRSALLAVGSSTGNSSKGVPESDSANGPALETRPRGKRKTIDLPGSGSSSGASAAGVEAGAQAVS